MSKIILSVLYYQNIIDEINIENKLRFQKINILDALRMVCQYNLLSLTSLTNIKMHLIIFLQGHLWDYKGRGMQSV